MTKTRKILLCALICFILILTCAVTAFAAQNSTSIKPITTGTVQNPLYEGLADTSPVIHANRYYGSEEAGKEFAPKCTEDYEETVQTLRDGMENRTDTITLYIASKTAITETWISQLVQNATAETDKPTQGDYLRWAWQSYKASCGGFYDKDAKLYYAELILKITYYTTKAQEEELTTEVNRVINSFQFTSKTTSTQKVKTIYEYITQNVRYDYKNLYDDSYTLKFSAYAALINKTAVCQGYALLFYRMAETVGVDTRVIVGKGNGGDHAWNISKLGDYYYYLDPTWDEGQTNFLYFLCGSEDFPDHVYDGTVHTGDFFKQYPIAKTHYDKDPSIDPDKKYRIFTKENVTLEFTHTDYTGIEICPQVQVVYDPNPDIQGDEITLEENKDYTLTYGDNISPGTATVFVTGMDLYWESLVELTFQILPLGNDRVFTKNDIVLEFTQAVYTGAEIKPQAQVFYNPDSGATIRLKENTDYTLSYLNNTAIGTATITITGIGHYQNCFVQLTYQIIPKTEAKVANLSGKLTAYNRVSLTWTDTPWINSGEDSKGYAIYYRKNTDTAYKYLTSFSETHCIIKNLAANTKYDFKVVKSLTYGEQTYIDHEAASFSITTLALLKNAEPMTVTLTGKNTIEINWTPVPTAHGYMLIWRKNGDAEKWHYDRFVSPENISYLDENLEYNTDYDYTIIPYHIFDGSYYVITSAPYHTATTLSEDYVCPTHIYQNCCDIDCNFCGQTRTAPHDYAAATCTTAKTCKVCGTPKGKALGHTSDSGTTTKKATCTATGTKTYKCTRCKVSVKTETLAKLGHNYSSATCTTAKTCTRCKKTSGDPLGHTYDSGKTTKKATCKATGVKTYTCKCGATKTSTIKKLTTHTYKTTTTKATTSKDGKIVKKCSVCKKTTTTVIRKAKTIKLSATSYTYNGKVKKPTVTIKDSAGKTISSSNYTIKYASGRKNVGTYKVTITFKGKYSGTKVLTFKIVPKAASVNKLTGEKKAVTVKLNKQTTQTSGYQIQYATKKTFTSAKATNITSNKTTTKTIKSLKAKTTYYVRVRSYKTVSGTKIYSAWSSAKSVKTK